jgi:hypothetical protein
VCRSILITSLMNIHSLSRTVHIRNSCAGEACQHIQQRGRLERYSTIAVSYKSWFSAAGTGHSFGQSGRCCSIHSGPVICSALCSAVQCPVPALSKYCFISEPLCRHSAQTLHTPLHPSARLVMSQTWKLLWPAHRTQNPRARYALPEISVFLAQTCPLLNAHSLQP